MSQVFTYSNIHEKFFKEYGQGKQYKSGYPIVWDKSETDIVFFLESGLVQATLQTQDNSDSVLGYFLPGMTFAQSGSFFNNRTQNLLYESIAPSNVYVMQADLFWEKIYNDFEFGSDYLKCVLKYNLLLIDRIAYINEKGIQRRIARWLLFMAKFYSKEIQNNAYLISIPLKQETIANFLSCSRESVSTTLGEFSRAGYIKIDKKQITIQNIEALKNI